MTSPLEQKKIKITGPVVVTANRVGDGAVVYRRADGGWTTDTRRRRGRDRCRPRAQELMAGAASPTIWVRSAPMSRRSSSRRTARSVPGNLRELDPPRRPDDRSAGTFGI